MNNSNKISTTRLVMRQVQQQLRFLEHQARLSEGEVAIKRNLRVQFGELEKSVQTEDEPKRSIRR